MATTETDTMHDSEDVRWALVPGYTKYRVSNYGNIHSLKRNGEWMPLLARPGRQGYPQVVLYKNGETRTRSVHSLILLAFVGPRPEGMVCRHLNDDPRDNRLCNLAWGTPSQNTHDSIINRAQGRKPYRTPQLKGPRPFYRTARNAWVVEINRRRRTLVVGPRNETEAEAWRMYHRVMAEEGRSVEPTANYEIPFLCDLFLDHIQNVVKPNTYEQYKIKLTDFARFHRTLSASELKPLHVTSWEKSHKWSDSTRRGAITAVKVCMAWCEREGHLKHNPIADVKRPRMGRRERTVTAEERELIRAEFTDGFADFLDALGWTGARPGEIMRLEAKHIDFAGAYAALPGKTTAATGELIEFPLASPMLDLCRRLADANPEGPIFRNADGNPWTVNAVRCRMRRLRKRIGIEGITAYTYRHSFATDALERGVAITDVAALMNHRDVRTTMNYNHLKQRREHLGRKVEEAIGTKTPCDQA